MHYLICKLKRRHIYPTDYSLRRTCLYRLFQKHSGSVVCTILCSWVWAYYNGISCLKCQKYFKYSCGCRVCCRNNGSYNTYRLSNFSYSKDSILFNYTASLSILVCIVNILCSVMVLYNLIL